MLRESQWFLRGRCLVITFYLFYLFEEARSEKVLFLLEPVIHNIISFESGKTWRIPSLMAYVERGKGIRIIREILLIYFR